MTGGAKPLRSHPMDKPAFPMSRSLFAYALLYGGMVCIAGVLGAKQVAIGPLKVEAGIFGFLILVILGSATAELHGRAVADKLVRIGFVPLLVSMVAFLATILPVECSGL